MTTNDKSDLEIISIYSRADAIADGELVDLASFSSTKPALLNSFKVPVALTRTLFLAIEEIPENSGEDLNGRINDVLFMAALAARSEKDPEENTKLFEVLLTNLGGYKQQHQLLLHIGPGDNAEPVITIGFPEDF